MRKPAPRPIKPNDPMKKASTVSTVLAWIIAGGFMLSLVVINVAPYLPDFEYSAMLLVLGWRFCLPFIATAGAVLSVLRLGVAEIPKWKDISVLALHLITLTFFVTNFFLRLTFTDPLAQQMAVATAMGDRLQGSIDEKTGLYEDPSKAFRVNLSLLEKDVQIQDGYDPEQEHVLLTLSNKEMRREIESLRAEVSPEDLANEITRQKANMKVKILSEEKRSQEGVPIYRIVFEDNSKAGGIPKIGTTDQFISKGRWFRLTSVTTAIPTSEAAQKRGKEQLDQLWTLFSTNSSR